MKPANVALVLVMVVVALGAAPGAAADDLSPRYPIMQPDRATLERWIHDSETAPRFELALGAPAPPRGSVNLLSRIQYTPAQRNQGYCGNCWAWAGTGAVEVALDLEGVHDRLSVQYLNSCDSSGWACCGG